MKPCDECPFRASVRMAYDADAMEALDEGFEPSCHKIVGPDNIFTIDYPTTTRCAGHDAWVDGVEGFAKPNLLKESA